MELRWKFYKTKKEGNKTEDGKDVVGWGRHFRKRGSSFFESIIYFYESIIHRGSQLLEVQKVRSSIYYCFWNPLWSVRESLSKDELSEFLMIERPL